MEGNGFRGIVVLEESKVEDPVSELWRELAKEWGRTLIIYGGLWPWPGWKLVWKNNFPRGDLESDIRWPS